MRLRRFDKPFPSNRFLPDERVSDPLALFERRWDPGGTGARQDAFCERQEAFDVEFSGLAG